MAGEVTAPAGEPRFDLPDLNARILYFPVRHHSPACAWHVRRLIREVRPDHVLIEGPRDATPLLPLLLKPETALPVAIYTTYVRRQPGEEPARHAAYYPLCDYSPEMAALRAAGEVGAQAAFIDLTFPESVTAQEAPADDRVQSLLGERYLAHSRFLRAACQHAGARDSDDLWDHLYEDGFEQRDTAEFMRGVLAYCALARMDYTPKMLAAEGHPAREAAMAHAVARAEGRVVVVTGGFHTVALPDAAPALPAPVSVPPEDAQVVLARYSFEQLDRLNGYASGMPSPEFYQRRWESQEPARLLVELAVALRAKGAQASADDEIAALAQARRLAGMRGHRAPTREDLLDGIRSAFIKGSVDVEGVLVLSLARKLLAGERVGSVPPEAGQPPIVADFRDTATALRVRLETHQVGQSTLDIYRSRDHREASRFFHRLRFLDVPFGTCRHGPDFVAGEHLELVREIWEYRWTPDTETALIERSLYGPTLPEAAAALLLERFAGAEKEGQGRRADVAAALLLDGCRMGLHKQTPDLVRRTALLVSEDASFVSLVRAIGALLALHTSREPLEAHHLEGLVEIATRAFERACYLLPSLADTSEEEEEATLDALNAFSQAPAQLELSPEHAEMLWERLAELVATAGANAALQGSCCGLLFADGRLAPEALVVQLQGHLRGMHAEEKRAAAFVRGLLRSARSALWQVPGILAGITEVLDDWEEERFLRELPHLRLAFAGLTPRECDRVARAVAQQAGVAALPLISSGEFTSFDMARGAEVDRRVRAALERDGLG